MTQLLVGFGVPLLILLLSIPMILGKVPPNGAYGFRTPKTMSSPDIWYPANRMSGWFMAVAGLVSICFSLGLMWAFPQWSEDRTLMWMTGGMLVPLTASLVASFIYLGRL